MGEAADWEPIDLQLYPQQQRCLADLSPPGLRLCPCRKPYLVRQTATTPGEQVVTDCICRGGQAASCGCVSLMPQPSTGSGKGTRSDEAEVGRPLVADAKVGQQSRRRTSTLSHLVTPGPPMCLKEESAIL